MIISHEGNNKVNRCKHASKRRSNNQFEPYVEPYVSPLNCLKTSMTQVTDVARNLLNGEKELQKLNRLNTTKMSRNKFSLCNATIVINDDDDNEIICEKMIGKENITLTNTKRRRENPISPHLHHKSMILERRKRKRSVILLDTSSSSQQSSTLESYNKNKRQKRGSSINSSPIVKTNSRNPSNTVFNKKGIIVPTKVEDDIVELWSCLNNPSKRKISKQNEHKNKDKPSRGKLKIDAISSTRNLELSNVFGISSRLRKKQLYSTHKISCPNESIIQTISNSNDGKQKRKFNENMKLDLIQSNGNFKKKTRSTSSRTSEDSLHKLREIIIDGCNIALLHTMGRSFSVKGLLLTLNYFLSKGHVVKIFLPQRFQNKKRYPSLEKLYKEGIVIFTPSRYIDGRQIQPYDDRYILEYATKCKGVVISSDQYRDLYEENPEWRETILNRLLTPTFVEDYIMFPQDPLGRSGPNLDTFLRH